MISHFRNCILAILVTLSYGVSAQSFNINVRLNNLNDSLLLLASYAGDKQFVIDTAFPDKQYNYRFKGDTLLPEGMYIIAGANKNKLFDFIVAENQQVQISGDKNNLPSSLKSKYSDQNKLLFDYVNFLAEKQQDMASLQKLKKSFTAGSDSAKVVENRMKMIDEEVQRYIQGLINSYKGKFISVFLNSMQEPEIPDAPVLSNGRPDSVFAFNMYKKYFWDNIDLSDGRIIRTPILHSKVEQYLSRLTVPVPDSLIKSIDKLISMTGSNYDSFKYLLWYLTIKYEGSEIMGHDAVLVHIIDNYFQDSRMSWINPVVKENLIKRADKLRPILIGKTAPELILIDTLGIPQSLHGINRKYTLIYFWDPDCSHCKKETPLLTSFYKEKRTELNFEVYAVCMDTSWKAMKEYIKKNQMQWINVNGFYSMTGDFRELYDVHSSPVMYLLDEQKKIIAKRILTEQIKMIIEKREDDL